MLDIEEVVAGHPMLICLIDNRMVIEPATACRHQVIFVVALQKAALVDAACIPLRHVLSLGKSVGAAGIPIFGCTVGR